MRKYFVNVPYSLTVSKEVNEYLGQPTFQDDKFTHKVEERIVSVERSLLQIVDLFNVGLEIDFTDYSDIPQFYEDLDLLMMTAKAQVEVNTMLVATIADIANYFYENYHNRLEQAQKAKHEKTRPSIRQPKTTIRVGFRQTEEEKEIKLDVKRITI